MSSPVTASRPRTGRARNTGLWLAAVACLVALAAAIALAEPLPKETCDGLREEQAKLIVDGAKAVMAEGVEAARAKGAEALQMVERYIAVDEQLSFRCGLYRTRSTLRTDVEEGVGDPAQPTSEGPKVPPEPTAKPKAKPQPKTTRPRAGTTPPDAALDAPEPAAAKPKSEPKPKPKRKVDDAFRPPPAAGAPVLQ